MTNLQNLAALKDDMKEKNWTIASFTFSYKKKQYVVLVKRFIDPIKRHNEYALVQLEFMRYDDIEQNLILEANSNSLLGDLKTIREYFGIKYSVNLHNLMVEFSRELNKFIPTNVPDPKTYDETQLEGLNKSISNSDSEDPAKRYCYGTMLNLEGKFRSPFNADKTKIFRSTLFDKLGVEPRLSFCYSRNPNDEKTDAEIIANTNKL